MDRYQKSLIRIIHPKAIKYGILNVMQEEIKEKEEDYKSMDNE